MRSFFSRGRTPTRLFVCASLPAAKGMDQSTNQPRSRLFLIFAWTFAGMELQEQSGKEHFTSPHSLVGAAFVSLVAVSYASAFYNVATNGKQLVRRSAIVLDGRHRGSGHPRSSYVHPLRKPARTRARTHDSSTSTGTPPSTRTSGSSASWAPVWPWARASTPDGARPPLRTSASAPAWRWPSSCRR